MSTQRLKEAIRRELIFASIMWGGFSIAVGGLGIYLMIKDFW